VIFTLAAAAQEKLNYAEADKRSYELFQENKWSELIQFATEARQQGIDFFYLQVRTGIAWYNLGKYRNAAPWFLKAYSNDNSFEWLQEYVYYSLVFSGRQTEAAKYAPRFSDAVKKKIGYKEIGISRLAYETGYSFNPDFESLKTRDFKTEVNLGEDYGEGYFLKNYSFHSVDISNRVAANFTLNHNLTYIGVNREAAVDWSEKTNASIRINQFNYYINPIWLIGEKLNISPSLNLIFGSGDVYAGYINWNSTKAYQVTKKNYSDAVLSSAFWSNFSNFSPGLEFNFGNINDSKFTQLSSWVTWYPLSNTRLYLTPRIYFKSGNESFGWNAAGISGGATLGKIHVYGNYLWGHMENFVESAGYVIANFPGRSDRKIMANVFFPINKRYQFVLRYMNQNVFEKYQVYTDGYKTNSLEYNYLTHTLTAGISWNF
jgi:tetratricopeptide (TPR) repeat protein